MSFATARIDPKIDLYGTKGRATYLADYLEYTALGGAEVRLSVLVDMVKDNNWGRKDFDFTEPSSTWRNLDEMEDIEERVLAKFDDGDEDVCSRVEEILVCRIRHLRDRYPFQLIDQGLGARLQLSLPCDVARCRPYLALLSLTIAHAYKMKVDDLQASTVEDAFEALVAHCLVASGMPAVVIPTYEQSLRYKIPAAVRELGLDPQVHLASFSKYANDGGTDIVCHLPVGDTRRHPCFLFLGQATCGQTETWEDKAKEVNIAAWRKMLSMDYNAFSFLAVPHHVDPRYWPLLAQESQAAIIDRIRLVAMSETTTDDGTKVAAVVLGMQR